MEGIIAQLAAQERRGERFTDVCSTCLLQYLQSDSLLQQKVLSATELSSARALLMEGLQELLCVLDVHKHTHSQL